jgi:hypothetical protein
MNRRSFLRCLPIASVAIAAPADARPGTPLPDPVPQPPLDDDSDAREVIYECESCSRKLYEGDMHYAYDDGPVFCEEHAPTWNDLKSMQDEAKAGGYFEHAFNDPDHARDAEESVAQHLAAGLGNTKYVWGI